MKNNTKAVSITMPVAMYKEAEKLAKDENRTISELLRETIRKYIAAKQSWGELTAYGSARAAHLGIKPGDINGLIHEGRADYRVKSKK